MRTSVWFPAIEPLGTARTGRYPLVVFAHGFDSSPARYSLFLRTIASAGYVVAAPLFPISGAGLPGRPREDDLANQTRDLSAVVSAMVAAARPTGWLHRSLNPAEVAVIGHSDGAETVAGMLLVAAERDVRVKAAVVLAGQIPTWGNRAAVRVPTLVEQGNADTINPPRNSRDLYRRLLRPKAYLDILGGTHIGPVIGTDRRAQDLRDVVTAFLDRELYGDSGARHRMDTAGNQPQLTVLTDDL